MTLFGDFSDLTIEAGLILMLGLSVATLFARPGSRPIEGVDPLTRLASRTLLSASMGLMIIALGIGRETILGGLAGLGGLLGLSLFVRGLRLRRLARTAAA